MGGNVSLGNIGVFRAPKSQTSTIFGFIFSVIFNLQFNIQSIFSQIKPVTNYIPILPYFVQFMVAITGAVLLPDRGGLPFTSKIF